MKGMYHLISQLVTLGLTVDWVSGNEEMMSSGTIWSLTLLTLTDQRFDSLQLTHLLNS